MKKRLFSLVLCLVMVFSLLPAFSLNASAAEPGEWISGGTKDDGNGVKTEKNLYLASDGTYTLQMKVTADSETHQETQSVAMDYVLILDNVGREINKNDISTARFQTMTLNNGNIKESNMSSANTAQGNSNNWYYYKVGNEYYRLIWMQRSYARDYRDTMTDEDKEFLDQDVTIIDNGADDTTVAYMDFAGRLHFPPEARWNRNNDNSFVVFSGQYYKATVDNTAPVKFDAMKEAARSFIDQIPNGSRVLLLKSSCNDSRDLKQFFASNDQTYQTFYPVNSAADRQGLKDVITNVATNKYGVYQGALNKAFVEFMKQRNNNVNNPCAVIMFEGQVPSLTKAGSGVNSSSSQVYGANQIIYAANRLKMSPVGATIYHVLLGHEAFRGVSLAITTTSTGATSTLTSYGSIGQYANLVSSNTPPQSPSNEMDNTAPFIGDGDCISGYTGAAANAKDDSFKYANADTGHEYNHNYSKKLKASSSTMGKYVFTAANPEDVQSAIDQIVVDVTGSAVDLTEGNSYVQDVINSAVLDASGAICTAYGEGIDGGSQNVPIEDNTVQVHYDFTENFGPDKALTITITGLLPKQSGATNVDNSSGVFYKAEGESDYTKFASFEVPVLPLADKTYVADFNGRMSLATGAMLMLKDKTTTQVEGTNGNFTKENSNAYYQLKSTGALLSGSADLTYTANVADSAMIYGMHAGDSAAAWKKINVVPASNIYYADSFSDDDIAADDQIGYSVGQEATGADQNVQKKLSFTFTGSRIDVYLKTTSSDGTIGAILTTTDGNGETKKVTKMVACNTDGTYASTPAVSFDGLSGTSTLTITGGKNAAITLNGVRVYNEAANNVEKSVQYIKLREMLLDPENAPVQDKTETGALFFVTDGTNLKPTDTDPNTPTDTSSDAYKKYVPQTYKNLGPKHEVYLANGQAIGFSVDGAKSVMVGLRAPKGGVAYVSANGEINTTGDGTQLTNLDMYYPISPVNGKYVITNDTNVLVSATNVKLTDVPAGTGLSVSPELLTFMASFVRTAPADTSTTETPETPVTPEAPETPETNPKQVWNDAMSLLNQLFSRIMSALNQLFGGLGNW